MDALLIGHIAAGGTGLLSGYVALSVTKGARVHRRAGMAFVATMLTMCLFGGIIAQRTAAWVIVNTTAALLTAYLVATGLFTVRPPLKGGTAVHLVGMTVAFLLGAMALTFGFEAIASGGKRNGVPAFPYFLFGFVGLIGFVGDVRVFRSGPRHGPARLARHLWRMTFALWIATMSFFIGQADVFPKPIRIPALLAVPVLTVLAAMVYWLFRVRRKRVRSGRGSAHGLLGDAHVRHPVVPAP
jgi:hypothetical protein